MKCTNCSLLFLPTDTHMNCPRCGLATVSEQETQRVNGLQNEQLGRSYGTLAFGEDRARILPMLPPKIGFTIAGLCIFCAALILLFVYFTAMGLSSNTSSGSLRATPTSFPSRSATPVPSATATEISLPGKRFIDKAQTATAVDINTGRVIGPNNTFTVNQKVYISFSVHPAGQMGVVCLWWYLNGKRTIQHYEFPVNADTIAYSFTTYQQPGAAYVEIYWAKTTACADKSLAQHVDFTVTA